MSGKKICPVPTQISLCEDSLASPSVKLANKKPTKTNVTSGQKCLDLSENVGPLGLLEKTLLDSPNWAWTKHSLTWKTKATPQGHLIFQLARQAHRTSVNASGSSRTLEARANQEDNSTSSTRPDTWATPNTMDHLPARPLELCSVNQKNRKGRKRSGNLREQVVHPQMWPTPTVSDTEGGLVKNVEYQNESFSRKNKKGERWGVKLKDAVNHVEMWPTPTATERSGINTKTGKGAGLSKAVKVTVQLDQKKTIGALNPMWVAWLMGYPTEYLSSVHWETQSSRKS